MYVNNKLVIILIRLAVIPCVL